MDSEPRTRARDGLRIGKLPKGAERRMREPMREGKEPAPARDRVRGSESIHFPYGSRVSNCKDVVSLAAECFNHLQFFGADGWTEAAENPRNHYRYKGNGESQWVKHPLELQVGDHFGANVNQS